MAITTSTLRPLLSAAAILAGCVAEPQAVGLSIGEVGTDPTAAATTTPPGSTTDEGTTTSATAGGTTTSSTSDGSSESSGDVTGIPGFDVPDTDGEPDCAVNLEDGNAPPQCNNVAPAESFAPEVQWSWAGEGPYVEVISTPVVGNLTDDNGDGVVDLCDTPDVVVVAFISTAQNEVPGAGRIHVLDGETGALHYQIESAVPFATHPALGDIDGDGAMEIIVPTGDVTDPNGQRLRAFNNDGSVLWTAEPLLNLHSRTVALADLDNDGDVEIVLGRYVFDHEGTVLWESDHLGGNQALTNAVADLDGDDDMEIMMDGAAYHHDGSVYYDFDYPPQAMHPVVADIDGDAEPEVVITHEGFTIIEHDGTRSADGITPELVDRVPAAIHDVDGDGLPEILTGARNTYSTFEHDLQVKWSADVLDQTGGGAGTAFDFLGDATAEAMYADESFLFAFDDTGESLFTSPRTSWTQWEYPVVADVDNDGSAEIVVVSNRGPEHVEDQPPAVQVIRDAEDRWVAARRIWNQNTYHVTNVREDGTIPQVEPKHWLGLNTYRTQAQVESGQVCRPAG